MKRCLVVGAGGQDGQILCKVLQGRGHFVRAIRRGDLDLSSQSAVAKFVQDERPDEIYYLAAFHHSSEEELSISEPEAFRKSFEIHFHGVISFLEAMRFRASHARFFYAASSHIFGCPEQYPQTETTPYHPQNIYGISKAAGLHACRYYRTNYGVFAAGGILYNHESPWRADRFVSQKIVRTAVKISRGECSTLTLGNFDAEIDWGYAVDFVEAMTRILALDHADDYVVATGESHTVREFAEIAFRALGLNPSEHLREDPEIIKKPGTRLLGDASRLRERTGWAPSLSFSEMVHQLVEHCKNAG